MVSHWSIGLANAFELLSGNIFNYGIRNFPRNKTKPKKNHCNKHESSRQAVILVLWLFFFLAVTIHRHGCQSAFVGFRRMEMWLTGRLWHAWKFCWTKKGGRANECVKFFAQVAPVRRVNENIISNFMGNACVLFFSWPLFFIRLHLCWFHLIEIEDKKLPTNKRFWRKMVMFFCHDIS